jgi:hypothetical protein
MDKIFSDFIVYVDESGDHGMQSLDENYPIFVLVFCIFFKKHYRSFVVPKLQEFKFKHFGHDLIILHEHEIRKEKGAFRCFKDKNEKILFLDELTGIINDCNFVLATCVIDKMKLKEKQTDISNPYHIALGHCLESLNSFLIEKKQENLTTHIIVEERGKTEDNELELEFRRIKDGKNNSKKKFPFEIIFANKKANSTGLQLADLMARPIGLHVLRKAQNNRAFDVLKQKFYCSGGRQKAGEGYDDWGLKQFP